MEIEIHSLHEENKGWLVGFIINFDRFGNMYKLAMWIAKKQKQEKNTDYQAKILKQERNS